MKQQQKRELVAIIGMACRFPGANDYGQFWKNMEAGVNSISEIPSQRWEAEKYYAPIPNQQNKTISKWAGLVEGIDEFDAEFFSISPREARKVDPQQRVILELSWSCIEDAGYSPSQLSGKDVGVFMGACNYDSILLMNRNQENIEGHSGTGTWTCMIPNRISSFFNWHGPSIPIDTACSSSLVAIHYALKSLKESECEMALVGGISVLFTSTTYIQMSQLGMLSPTGQCRTFSSDANGYVRGEGAGVVLLKPLTKAIVDGDHIYGVIQGSAINHGGKARTITSPNVYAQAKVIRSAYINANISPDTVSYIESHGTGTPLGDPIEINALKRAYKQLAQQYGVEKTEKPYCGIGAVKSNIGHLEGAAGIAGLIKVLLAMKYKKLPKILNFKELNPRIKIKDTPFYIIEENQEWKRLKNESGEEIPRRAGLSSFGIGGVNAHIVLEEPLEEVKINLSDTLERPQEILTLSAKTEKALRELATKYQTYLQLDSEASLSDICFSANKGQTHFTKRLAIVAESKRDLQQKLAGFLQDNATQGVFTGNSDTQTIAFLFTGQGSQYAEMGRQLYDTQPTFKKIIDQCSKILEKYLEVSLLDVLYPNLTIKKEEVSSLIDQTAYTQPAIFVIEYALAKLWESWGIKPDVVMGHSVGEYVAATVAGIFSLEDGLKLIAARGRLMQQLPAGGEMVAVMASEAKVKKLLRPYAEKVAIAAINGPKSVVISGEATAVREIVSSLESEKIKTKQLQVSHAFHSPLMEPMLAEWEAVAKELTYHQPEIPVISNVTGTIADKSITTAKYWVDHVRLPVRFTEGMDALQKQGVEIFLEVGPKPILLGMGRRCLPKDVGVWLPSLRLGVDEWQQMLSSLGQLYVKGVKIDWSGFDSDYSRQKVALPTYPFQRERYWVEENGYGKKLLSKQQTVKELHPLLGYKINIAGQQQIFESFLGAEKPEYLKDHRVFDEPLFPTTGYLEIALAAGQNQYKTSWIEVEDLRIEKGLVLLEGEVETVQTILTPQENQTYQFQIFSQEQQGGTQQWVLHVAGKIQQAAQQVEEEKLDIEKYLGECDRSIEIKQHYQRCQSMGISYGSSFQGIKQLWKGENQALAKLAIPEALAGEMGEYNIHPVILDAALQVIFNALPEAENENQTTYLPVGVEKLTTYSSPEESMYAYGVVDGTGGGNWKANVILSTETGKIVGKISGLRVKAASKEALLGSKQETIKDLLYEIEWRSKGRLGRLLPPDYLLAPTKIEQQLQPTIRELIAQANLESYQEIPGKLEELSLEYVLQAIKELGWYYKVGDKLNSEQEIERLSIVPSQKQLFKRMLQMLGEAGIIEPVVGTDEWNVVQTLDNSEEQGPKKGEKFLSEYPQAAAELTLLNRCGTELSGVLQGATDPVELVFPSGDLTAATRVYQDSTLAKFMNSLVEKTIATAIEKLPKDQGIRLLEIGAGTGGTTSYILPTLPETNTEYVFTDLGVLFTTKAKERFQDYPYVEYRTLDIEVDPTTQGYNAHQYDVIIAANVLHATTNIKEILSNVRKLLAPGGILVLFEITSRQRWLDLVFGLLEGWWRFEDLDIRPDYPLLSRSQWQEVLMGTGFTEVATLPEVEGMPQVLSQQSVIIAQADSTASVPDAKGWLILADKQGIGQHLARQLESFGGVCTVVFAGEKYQQITPEEFTINPDRPEDYEQLMTAVVDKSPALSGVVQCWTTEFAATKEIKDLSRWGCGTTLFLVQALLKSRLQRLPQLWLVTSGSQPVPLNSPLIPGVSHSSLWGMGKVINLEHPELNCVRIDLDPEATVESNANLLFNEIWSEDKEDQVALRENSRYVARLVASHHQRVATGGLTIPSQPYKLGISEKSSLDKLILEPINRNAPAAGEVEIQVMATGLNFLDLVATLGLVPDEVDGVSQKHLVDINRFGVECSGYVVAVGEGVKGLEVGDMAIAMAQGSFSQYVTVNASYVVPKPENITFEEAASIPANFLTAYYALHHIAKITKGQRILIHAAAGGTGMAAVQIAQKAGAEVFATASPPKWETLRKMGVKYIMNSRTVEFADQVMEFTEGQGVDIVLNSLTSGDFVRKGLSVVSPQGRFIEIAKRGVWKSSQVAEVRPDISYSIVDLLRKSQEEPELINSMLQELTADFSNSLLKPPPLKVFPIEEVISAFRYMQQAKHIGKIVVTQPKQPDKPVSFRGDAAYLITGGMGGLGLLISRWMVSKGAKHLVLLGRRAPNEVVKEKLVELEAAGASVTVETLDVSDWEGMKGVIERINNSGTPLAGVMHSVGVLSDGVLENQTWSSFEQVMAPKVQGSWYLHQLTQNQSLDFFLVFSSVASLFGSSTQANHSAANAFLDGLAHYRRSLGLPGLSIHWGTISQVGEAAERGADVRLQKQGIAALTPTEVLESLEVLMSSNANTEVAVVDIDWSKWQERASQWRFLADWEGVVAGVIGTETRLLEQLKESSSEEQEKMLVDYLKGKVANIFGTTTGKIMDIEQPLTTMGLDSLMAVELRNLIQRELGFDIPMQTIIEGISISEIVDLVSEQLLLEQVSYSNTSPTEEIDEDMEEITL